MSTPVPATTASRLMLRSWVLFGLLSVLLVACASLPADFKQPGVSVVAFTPRVLKSMTPEFEILLRVTNPNRKALDIAGLSYELRLAGSKVVEGVAGDLPRIEAYGEAEVMLRAHADLLGSLGVLSKLMEDPGAPFDYELIAEIDLGALYPTFRIERSGILNLQLN